MKKSTLLGALTAVALVATSATTFAVWDASEKVTDNSVSLSYKTPITIADMSFTDGNLTDLGGGSVATTKTADLPIAINGDTTGKTLKFTTMKEDGATEATIPTGLKVEYFLTDGTTPADGTAATSSTIKVKVTVTPNEVTDPTEVTSFTSFKVKVSLV